jgi:hypothetical protein
VEAEAAARQDGAGAATSGTAKIAEARGRLLQAARKAAENRQSGWPAALGEVIARASDGKLSLDALKNLTDADVAGVQAAITKMEGGAH